MAIHSHLGKERETETETERITNGDQNIEKSEPLNVTDRKVSVVATKEKHRITM